MLTLIILRFFFILGYFSRSYRHLNVSKINNFKHFQETPFLIFSKLNSDDILTGLLEKGVTTLQLIIFVP